MGEEKKKKLRKNGPIKEEEKEKGGVDFCNMVQKSYFFRGRGKWKLSFPAGKGKQVVKELADILLDIQPNLLET